MRFQPGLLILAALGTGAVTGLGQAQSASSRSAEVARIPDNRFKWFFGVSAGGLFFETQRQTRSSVPAAGAHISVISRRAGLLLGIDEGFGSDEPSAFIDASSGNQLRLVEFDRIRRYGFNLTGYPMRGMLEPYLGFGFGLIQVLNPQFSAAETFTSSEQAAASASEARNHSASGFVSALAGVQFRVGRIAAFGQGQLNSAPAAGDLLRGTGYSLMVGARFSLGSTRQDVKGGGY